MSIFSINTLLENDKEQPTDLSFKTMQFENRKVRESNFYQSQVVSFFNQFHEEVNSITTRNFFNYQYLFYLQLFSGFPKFLYNFLRNSPTSGDPNKTYLSSINFHTNSLNIDLSMSTDSSPGMSSPSNTDIVQFENIKVEKYFQLIDNLSQSQDSVEEIVKTIKIKRRNFADYIKKLYLNDPVKFKLTNGGDGIINPFRKQSKNERDKMMDKFCKEVERNYQCQICNKSFPSKKHMQRHIRSHGVNFDWLCKYCFKPFIDSYDLKRHTRVHTGVQPYRCDNCPRKFSQRCSLESHQVKIHGIELNYLYKERRNKLYPCEICSYSTSYKNTWLNHIVQEHPNSLYAQEETIKRKYN